jgi:hypothetical protein
MFGVMAETREASDLLSSNMAPQSSKTSSISTGSMKKPGNNKLLSIFFGKQSTMPKENTVPEMSFLDKLKHQDTANDFRGLVTPCPFIRPLEHKLQARFEPRPRPKAASVATASTGSSAMAIAINREEANRILNSSLLAQTDSVTELSTTEHGEGLESDIDSQISQQLEYVAVTSAYDSEAVQHWRYYIECYSKVGTTIPDLSDTLFEWLHQN